MGDTRGPDAPSRETSQERSPFGNELMRLKRRGCCILVTGRSSVHVRAAQSRQLFGAVDEPRRRILTLIDATPSETSQYFPDGITQSDSDVTVLDYTETVQDTTRVTGKSRSQSSSSQSDDPSKTGLGATLCDPIGAAIRNKQTEPGELRVGVATLDAIVVSDGRSATRAFVEAVRADILAANGMGHFHLPGSVDPATFDALAPVIDIHLELRESRPHIPEHRWHLLDTDRSTDWIPL